MFEDTADKIFAEAGVDKTQTPDLYREIVEILNAKMAQLSASMGLSYDRVRLFNEQKQALVEDLLAMKRSGEIA